MVTHCLCHDVSFERLKRLAEADGLDLESLKRRTGCCTGCGLCEPYVRLMLRTGKTSTPVLGREECERLMSTPAAQPTPGAANSAPTNGP